MENLKLGLKNTQSYRSLAGTYTDMSSSKHHGCVMGMAKSHNLYQLACICTQIRFSSHAILAHITPDDTERGMFSRPAPARTRTRTVAPAGSNNESSKLETWESINFQRNSSPSSSISKCQPKPTQSVENSTSYDESTTTVPAGGGGGTR